MISLSLAVTENGERSFESASSVTVRGQWRVIIDKSRRGRAGKSQCDVTLSTRAPPGFGPALRKRRSARPLCAPQARTVHTRQRATGARTLPACLPCVVVLCHQRHCRTTLQCRPLRDKGQGNPRASTQIAYTRAHCLLDCYHWVASHCTAAPRFSCRCPSRPQKQKLRGRSETS